MKPYQQSPYQIGPVPQPEDWRAKMFGALAAFIVMAGPMALVNVSEPATCNTPQQVASK